METQKNEMVKIDPKEFGLETASAEKITKGLTNILKERDVLSGQYAKVIKLEITSETIGTFRKLRLQVRDNRTKGIEAWHKVNKEFFLRGGQFVDAIKRKECEENIRMEEQLLKGEKHFELIEEEKKAKLKEERRMALEKYGVDTEPLSLLALGEMSVEVWENYFSGVKLQCEKVKEEERKAEADRIEKEKITKLHNYRKDLILNLWQFVEPELKTANLGEIDNSAWSNIVKSLNQEKVDYDDKQKEIKKENERLQKKTEAKEKQIQAERAEAEKERKIIEEKNRKEREALEEKTRKETEAKVKLEKELQARKDKEIQAEKEKQAIIENELSKGDNDKFQSLLNDLSALKTKHVFKSKKYQKKQQQVSELIDKIINFVY